MGTDNIIISRFIGLAEVGLYSNYYLVYKAGDLLIGETVCALTPTVGRKLALGSSEEAFSTFQKTRFVNFVFASVAATAYLNIMQPVICLWLGDQYLLSQLTLIVIAINFFQRVQRYAFSTFKEAAGIYYEDRFVPVFESIINIVASIILQFFFGLPGVFMGTIVSSLILWCYSYPKFVYKKLFKRGYFCYLKESIGQLVIFIICMLATSCILGLIKNENLIVTVLINGAISVVLSVAIILIMTCRTDGFKNTFNEVFKKGKK